MQNFEEMTREEFEKMRDAALSASEEFKLLENDHLICECFAVSAGDIRHAFSEQKWFTKELLSQCFQMGTGCKGCFKEFENWQNKIF